MASSWVGDMVKGNYLLYLFYWVLDFIFGKKSPDKLGKLDMMMSPINFYYIRRLKKIHQ